ncbi:hypothetical protein H6P81_017245 [Aristolochia fimbriata]|uniref:Myb-like domain-containing protein n=1 Tax=Aristolochia fimbriata TaxID=158543 RepID=A0AAV7E0N7_ARIFI|nr:hypothetical protein H6P81_017245 [Aristolochia fimbriata]
MPKTEVLGRGTPPRSSEFSLRRSPRFRSVDAFGCERTRARKNQVPSSPIPAYKESSFGSEFSVQGFDKGVDPPENKSVRRSLRLLNRTEKQVGVNGSRTSKGPNGAAESFLVLRRSPRFTNSTDAGKRFSGGKKAYTEEGAQIEKCKFDESMTKCRSLAFTGNKGRKSLRNSGEKKRSIRNDVFEKPNRATQMKGSSDKHVTERKRSSRKVEGKCAKNDECDKYREKRVENQFRQRDVEEQRASFEATDKRRSRRDTKKVRESLDPQEEKKKANLPEELCRTKMCNSVCEVSVAKEENGSLKVASGNLQKDTAHHEWTDNQEAALRRAYFAQKPTPNFWKEVSRQVPGKSAQDCFNRIFGELPTPQQHHPRSRARGTNISPLSDFSLSASKLLEPRNLKTKKSQSLKHKTGAQKIARHLLKRQHLADQNQEADLFSVFEGDTRSLNQMFSPIKMLTTPDPMQRSKKFLPKCHGNSSEKDMLSPPVLKRVKNMALHEKYIDQLHSRDAKRKRMAKFRSRNLVSPQEGANKNKMPKPAIGAAKTALLSDATNFIKVFKQTQEVSAWEGADFESDEGESEDEF